VFCEKPLALDPGDAKQILARADSRVFVMDKWRYHPGVEALGEIARSGELGKVLGLSTRRLGWGNPHADADAAWILLPHDLSIALEILGVVPKPVRAVAERDASGLMTLSAWLEDPVWMSCEISTRYPGHLRSVELRCEAGVAKLTDAYETKIQILRTGNWRSAAMWPAWERRPVGDRMPLLAELSAFVAHLGGGPPPRSSAAEGLVAVETIAALRGMAGLGS
jgi:predicted dehydrogenase